MLPDQKALKRRIQEVFDAYLKRRVAEQMGLFGKTPKQIVHEGDRLSVIRADGSTEVSPMHQASAELTIATAEAPYLSVAERKAKLDGLADEMARQISEKLFCSLGKSLDEAGQAVDAVGRKLDAEAVLAVLDRMDIDFGEDGRPNEISVVVPPGLIDSARDAFSALENDPDLNRKYIEVIKKKRAAWRDREASRKLVG